MKVKLDITRTPIGRIVRYKTPRRTPRKVMSPRAKFSMDVRVKVRRWVRVHDWNGDGQGPRTGIAYIKGKASNGLLVICGRPGIAPGVVSVGLWVVRMNGQCYEPGTL